ESFAVAIRRGDVARAELSQTLLDDCVDACRYLRIDERCELRVFIISRTWDDLRQTFCECFGDLVGVRRCPDCRSVYARAAAVVGDRGVDDVEILFPVVNTIFADDDLAVAWAVYLNTWIVG